MESSKTLVVCGATGRQGGAVVRHGLAGGWHVRGLTRSPAGAKARALAALGVEVVGADMGDRGSLERAFGGAHGVFSVQNPMISGLRDEVAQGKTVARAAAAVGVRHLVYASAGTGEPTGVGSWDSKLAVEEELGTLDLPVTVLRPMAFMELMTDRAYFPPASTWHVMPKLMGARAPVVWLAVDDMGAIVAKAFGDPGRFTGQTLSLAADVRSIDECRAIFKEVRGRPPARVPMPVALFERLVGTDLTTMWRWLRTGRYPLETRPTREIHPDALTVREWLQRRATRSRR